MGTVRTHHLSELSRKVLTTLRERVRKKQTELWKNDSWILHQNNTLAHNALAVTQFLAKNHNSALQQPLYSPDLTLCDSRLFPKIKQALKGTHFESLEAVKQK